MGLHRPKPTESSTRSYDSNGYDNLALNSLHQSLPQTNLRKVQFISRTFTTLCTLTGKVTKATASVALHFIFSTTTLRAIPRDVALFTTIVAATTAATTATIVLISHDITMARDVARLSAIEASICSNKNTSVNKDTLFDKIVLTTLVQSPPLEGQWARNLPNSEHKTV
ncbi:hypothetical protein TSMEX_005173 [Taenia solium]|eukprot:TsM_000806300 transcript=TsM_000806300 gene=TsM_000806300